MVFRLFAYVSVLVLFAACTSDPASNEVQAENKYETQIRWTRYGIPHVKSNDWGSLGYGFAYATATDLVCVIAQDLVMVNGNLAKFMGPENGNIASDVFHRTLLTNERLQRFASAQSDELILYSEGYVAGYNRYLRDHKDALPASCNGKPWIRDMNSADVARLTVGIAIRYGIGRFKNDMNRAKPPGEAVAAGDTTFEMEAGLGSNGVAFGKALTESGRGILLGNPHYPWHGSSRFHMIHTTIPGVIDTMGVSLATTNAVSLGFNKDIAWTHTVSTALRSTVYELELNPDNALEYRYGEEYRPIDSRTVTVNVKQPDGEIVAEEHTVYSTHYGPLVVSDQLPWTNSTAYAIRDAVIDNTAGTSTYAALSVAKTVDEVEAAISMQGVYWTNTVATDRHGTAFYADISTTPNVDAELLDECRVSSDAIPSYVVVLDGSNEACEWKSDPRSKVAGALPADDMPRIKRDDYVTNSNDSYWLANPAAPLEGYSPIIGPEKTARTIRTRAGLNFVRELLADGKKLTANDMRGILYNHRNYGAELLLDDVLKVCADETPVKVSDETSVKIEPACSVLASWDRTANIDSAGNHIWTEFWRLVGRTENLYVNPFDPADPVNTPNGINVANSAVNDAVRQALAGAMMVLDEAGIALDARWGDIQFAERNGKKIPIPGGQGWAGMFSMIVANLTKDRGYNPIFHGNSYIQVITWDKDGNLKPGGILTYSQSPEADSDHYSDLTDVYSRGEWIDFPFTESEILADPELKTLTLAE